MAAASSVFSKEVSITQLHLTRSRIESTFSPYRVKITLSNDKTLDLDRYVQAEDVLQLIKGTRSINISGVDIRNEITHLQPLDGSAQKKIDDFFKRFFKNISGECKVVPQNNVHYLQFHKEDFDTYVKETASILDRVEKFIKSLVDNEKSLQASVTNLAISRHLMPEAEQLDLKPYREVVAKLRTYEKVAIDKFDDIEQRIKDLQAVSDVRDFNPRLLQMKEQLRESEEQLSYIDSYL